MQRVPLTAEHLCLLAFSETNASSLFSADFVQVERYLIVLLQRLLGTRTKNGRNSPILRRITLIINNVLNM